jgi:hypothetical protein
LRGEHTITSQSSADTPIPRTPDSERASYQTVLRLVGLHLDQDSARDIAIVETPDGFVGRYQPASAAPELVARNFLHDELPSSAARIRREREHNRKGDVDEAAPFQTYEDLLRAVGYELDLLEAHNLVVDEVDDSFMVTYQFLSPSKGYLPRKRLIVLGPREVRRLIDDAHSRRTPKHLVLLTMLKG